MLYRSIETNKRERLIEHWRSRLEDLTADYLKNPGDEQAFLMRIAIVHERLSDLRNGQSESGSRMSSPSAIRHRIGI